MGGKPTEAKQRAAELLRKWTKAAKVLEESEASATGSRVKITTAKQAQEQGLSVSRAPVGEDGLTAAAREAAALKGAGRDIMERALDRWNLFAGRWQARRPARSRYSLERMIALCEAALMHGDRPGLAEAMYDADFRMEGAWIRKCGDAREPMPARECLGPDTLVLGVRYARGALNREALELGSPRHTHLIEALVDAEAQLRAWLPYAQRSLDEARTELVGALLDAPTLDGDALFGGLIAAYGTLHGRNLPVAPQAEQLAALCRVAWDECLSEQGGNAQAATEMLRLIVVHVFQDHVWLNGRSGARKDPLVFMVDWRSTFMDVEAGMRAYQSRQQRTYPEGM